MYLTTHMAAGLLAGAGLQNPYWGFTVGVISHFVLDAIPHEHRDDMIEENPLDHPIPPEKLRRRVIISLIDAIIMVVLSVTMLAIVYSRARISVILFSVIFGIFGGLLPDLIVTLSLKIDNSFMRYYFDMHNRTHNLIINKSVSRLFSLMYQSALVILCIGLSLKFID